MENNFRQVSNPERNFREIFEEIMPVPKGARPEDVERRSQQLP